MEKKNNKGTLILVLAIVLVLGAAYAGYTWLSKNNAPDQLTQQESQSSASQSQEPVQVPSFRVYDREGNAVELSDFFGKPIILNFWASWCGPCKMEMPDFDAAYQKYGEDIHFLMVNATDGQRETVEGAAQFIDGQGYTFPVYFDSDFDASMTYGVRGLPTTYFIDAEGYAVARAQSTIDSATLQKGIDMILPAE